MLYITLTIINMINGKNSEVVFKSVFIIKGCVSDNNFFTYYTMNDNSHFHQV